MAPVRKSQVYFDNTSNSLTEYSSDCNGSDLEITREVLDDTGLNEDDMSNAPGIRSWKVTLTGFVTALNTGIAKALIAAKNTTVTKTFQKKIGSRYFNGETVIQDLKFGSDGKKLIPFTATLVGDGALNETATAL